jgi:hypothetical protein
MPTFQKYSCIHTPNLSMYMYNILLRQFDKSLLKVFFRHLDKMYFCICCFFSAPTDDRFGRDSVDCRKSELGRICDLTLTTFCTFLDFSCKLKTITRLSWKLSRLFVPSATFPVNFAPFFKQLREFLESFHYFLHRSRFKKSTAYFNFQTFGIFHSFFCFAHDHLILFLDHKLLSMLFQRWRHISVPKVAHFKSCDYLTAFTSNWVKGW